MTNPRKFPKILVVYNQPASARTAGNSDYISEAGVEQEAQAVTESLLRKGYLTEQLAVCDLRADLLSLSRFQPDVIFNLCEGYRGNAGKEMYVAGIWELLGLPYTGNSPLTLGMAQDKVLSKTLFAAENILTPPYQVFQEIPEALEINFPAIVKPSREDASLGISHASVVTNLNDLRSAVGKVIQEYRQPALVESFIAGREFSVSVLGNQTPRILAISEIDFSQLAASSFPITSYEAKWLEDHPLYLKTPAVVPAEITSSLAMRLSELALRVYQTLGGRDYGRVDMRMDEGGRNYVLEYNPNPDISPKAGYAKALQAAGIAYDEFVEFLINEALKRGEINAYSHAR